MNVNLIDRVGSEVRDREVVVGDNGSFTVETPVSLHDTVPTLAVAMSAGNGLIAGGQQAIMVESLHVVRGDRVVLSDLSLTVTTGTVPACSARRQWQVDAASRDHGCAAGRGRSRHGSRPSCRLARAAAARRLRHASPVGVFRPVDRREPAVLLPLARGRPRAGQRGRRPGRPGRARVPRRRAPLGRSTCSCLARRGALAAAGPARASTSRRSGSDPCFVAICGTQFTSSPPAGTTLLVSSQ